MGFPVHRPRRLRRSENLRAMVRETHLRPEHLMAPLFVQPGSGRRDPIASMPGECRLSIDELVAEVQAGLEDGVRSVILFGIPPDGSKDHVGTPGWIEDGIVQEAVAALKKDVPGVLVATDVCLCEYTDHGHCGVLLPDDTDGHVQNDPSLELLAREALSHARAGADMVAPSDMMDGRVGAIRAALDGAGYNGIPIMAYAAKYASAYYGPFRDAADSAPEHGDRRTYQMDPPNAREALREIALDIEEGADIAMVKPAGPYLDILAAARREFDVPLAAYQVSGEFSMICAAEERGWIDGDRVVLESLLGIRRAGADLILTYFARRAARLLAR
jgi:porphobilinogen synthase